MCLKLNLILLAGRLPTIATLLGLGLKTFDALKEKEGRG
jgi:hypothetical protein